MKTFVFTAMALAISLLIAACESPIVNSPSSASGMTKEDFERSVRPTHVDKLPAGVVPLNFESYEDAAEFISAMRASSDYEYQYPEGYFSLVTPGTNQFHFDTKADGIAPVSRATGKHARGIQGLGKTLFVHTKGEAQFTWGYAYDGTFLRYVKIYSGVTNVNTWVEGYVIGATYQPHPNGSSVSFGVSHLSMTLTGYIVVYYTVTIAGNSSMSSESGSATAYFGQ